uniref:Polycomb group RING finger protein 3 n=1 Tax=Aceria tosichella TaxID=561515 RepID=A0A6G1SNH2_9ACAR
MGTSSNIKLSELNEFISCPVCHGYLIDATTVNECLHTFCKSCIVKHIQNDNNECPKCQTVIHERRPLDYILYDRSKQDIVYKLVPQLYISEMNRRMAVQDLRDIDPFTKLGLKKKFLYIALVQQRKTDDFATRNSTNSPQPHSESNNRTNNDPIYLRCPIDVKVRQIRKLLAVKYQLDSNDRLQLFYKGDTVSDADQISNLAQSISFVLHYEISKIYPSILDQASTSSSTISYDSDKMSVDEIK